MDPLPLLRRDDLHTEGLTDRGIAAARRCGALTVIRAGVMVRTDSWRAASPERRIVTRAVALHRTSARPPVFSHTTAAACLDLPLYRPRVDTVHVIAPDDRPGRASGVIRHRGALTIEDVTRVNGLLVTTPARTVADVARTAPHRVAVTVADAALRRLAVTEPGAYADDVAETFRQEAMEIAGRSSHGVRRAISALRFADGRAQLPGESVSRVVLHELGFRGLDLQFPVAGPSGTTFYLDFRFTELAAFGEFDGRLKYVDGRWADGRSGGDELDREKRREDWIRGTTQHRLARWGWDHLRTREALESRLAAFGIHPRQ